jgi:hypothetical protein
MPAASKLKRAFSIVVFGPKGMVLANVGALVVETNAPVVLANEECVVTPGKLGKEISAPLAIRKLQIS